MPKNKVFRFGFGSAEESLASVWRLVANPKTGDVYLNNLKDLANIFHASFHASGQCHFKLGDSKRENLASPRLVGDRLIAFAVFFRELHNPLPAAVLPENIYSPKIRWLGKPSENGMTIVQFFYTPVGAYFSLSKNEDVIFTNIPARMFGREMFLHATVQKRALSFDELLLDASSKIEHLEFEGKPPPNLTYARVTKTKHGFSALVYDRFTYSAKSEAKCT